MPSMNKKNLAISPAAQDLGIGNGNMLQEQMQAKMDEIRKKQKGAKQDRLQSPAADMLLNPTFGGMNG